MDVVGTVFSTIEIIVKLREYIKEVSKQLIVKVQLLIYIALQKKRSSHTVVSSLTELITLLEECREKFVNSFLWSNISINVIIVVIKTTNERA